MIGPKVFRLALAVSVLLAGPVAAQDPSPKDENAPAPEVTKPGKAGKTVYDFDEVDILGKLKKPEGQSVLEPPEFRFRRLLDLDESFLPNIVRSVDEF
jgi:hypothetical protein